jgi:molybdopterin molybdotransferase
MNLAPEPQPLGVDELRRKALERIQPMTPFPQPLMESLGLAAAEDVYADVALPRFDNAAVDGYAVRHRDVAGATPDAPVALPMVGELGAGQSRMLALAPVTAARITAGAPIPTGADTVVPAEWTDRGGTQVMVRRAPGQGGNVRPAGANIAAGDLVLRTGTTLGVRELAVLASVGRASVVTRPRPRVVVIATGSELREPGQPLAHDSVYDANSYLVAATVRATGAVAFRAGVVADDAQLFRTTLDDQLVRADIVVTTGGTSSYDVVRSELTSRGIWFGEVSLPGVDRAAGHGFGLVGDSSASPDDQQVPIFALPGDPAVVAASLEAFVLPALDKMMGRTPVVGTDL